MIATVMEKHKWKIRILFGCAVGLYFFANFQRNAVPGPIFSRLQMDLHGTASQISALGSCFMYVYAVSQLAAGFMADRFGGMRVIAWGSSFFCLGALLFPFAGFWPLLYLARILTGLGASSIYLSLVKETGKLFPGKFGRAFGCVMLIGYAGGIAANTPFISGVELFGWRSLLMLAAFLMIAVYTLFLLTVFSTPKQETDKSVLLHPRTFLGVWKSRQNFCIILVSSLSFGIYYVYQTVIGKKFLEDFCSMDLHHAGWVLTASGALSCFSSFLSPFLCDLAGKKRKPFLLFMGGGTLFAMLLFAGGIAVDCRGAFLYLTAIFFLTCAANMTPVFLALMAESNPAGVLGVTVSTGNFTAYIFVALLGNLTGALMDIFPPERVRELLVYGQNSYLCVFGLFLILALPGFIASLFIRETGGKPRSEAGS